MATAHGAAVAAVTDPAAARRLLPSPAHAARPPAGRARHRLAAAPRRHRTAPARPAVGARRQQLMAGALGLRALRAALALVRALRAGLPGAPATGAAHPAHRALDAPAPATGDALQHTVIRRGPSARSHPRSLTRRTTPLVARTTRPQSPLGARHAVAAGSVRHAARADAVSRCRRASRASDHRSIVLQWSDSCHEDFPHRRSPAPSPPSAVLVLSGPAFAHVSVQPQGEAAKGGYATINFKVPNERDNASTTKLEVNFPTDHPLASVMPQPVPGWTSRSPRPSSTSRSSCTARRSTRPSPRSPGPPTARASSPASSSSSRSPSASCPRTPTSWCSRRSRRTTTRRSSAGSRSRRRAPRSPRTRRRCSKLTAATEADHHGAAATDDRRRRRRRRSARAPPTATAGRPPTAVTPPPASSASSASSSASAGVAFGVLAGRRRTA